jgi:hypothetical protein
MSPLHPARRSAERFDSLVQGGGSGDADRRTSDLLELVGALRSIPEPQARPDFVSGLREQLMLAAESELVAPATGDRDDVSTRLTVKPGRTRGERRVGLALGAFAVVGATTSMAVASQGALPGDSLYPLKRAIENTQAGFSVGDDAKGETILGNASDRLDEVGKLTRRDDPDAELIASTLDAFSDQATEAGDLLMSDYEQHGNEASIEGLHGFTVESINVLSALEEEIPAAAEDSLLNAAHAILTLDAAADNVCPTCSDVGITEVPGQLLASGESAIDEAGQALANGTLPGTQPSDSAAAGLQGPGRDEAQGPSGQDPPENPISIPPLPTEATTGATTDPGGGLLPTAGVNTGTGTAPGHGGGKDKTPKPPTLDEVSGAVDDVVNGVVAGVNDVIAGLTGQPPQDPTRP